MDETSLTLQTAARLLWENKFSCKGRVTRLEFWLNSIVLGFAFGIAGIGTFLLIFLSLNLYEGTLFAGVVSLFLLFVLGIMILMIFLLYIVLYIRRFHDIGKSGWWVMMLLVPMIGAVVSMLWVARPSDEENQYGPKRVY